MDTSFPDRLPSFENDRRRKTKELTVVTTKERTETRTEERYIDIKTQVNIKRKITIRKAPEQVDRRTHCGKDNQH